MLTEKNYQTKEITEETKTSKMEVGEQEFYYPSLGMKIVAKNAKEAQEKLEKALKEKYNK